MATEVFNFSVDSALLGELGEKLVSTVHVALAELVKNAYDADASEMWVKILPQAGKGPRLVVSDNGVGMTLDQVRKFWMKIGTSSKNAEPVTSRFGRLKTGSKGIGRFACRRLGLNLQLATCAKIQSRGQSRYQTTRVSFDWTDFAAGIDVESVVCEGETSSSSTGEPGTRLEIWGGDNDEWQLRGFEYLQRQLAALASNRGTVRPGFQEDPGFNVILQAPGLSEEVLIDVRESVIEASWGTLIAHIDGKGRAVCELTAKGLGGTKKLFSKQLFQGIVGASLRLGILPTRKDEVRKPHLLSQYVLTELINEWGGIQIRLNGFRVFPYGDSRDDWLRIDADRGRRVGKPDQELFAFAASLEGVDPTRVLLNMLGMRNYMGQVEVSSEIPGLTPRIDRQGFIENETFDELRRFARFAVDWANIHRDHYIRLRDHEESRKAIADVRPIIDLDVPQQQIIPKAASFLKDEIRRIVKRLPPTQQKATQDALVRTVRAIETVGVESQRQLEHLRLIASASTLTLLFAHEVRTVIGTLGAVSQRLGQLAEAIPTHSKSLNDAASQVRETKDRFDTLVNMTGIVGAFSKVDGFDEIHLMSAVERALSCFQLVIGNYSIDAKSIDVPASLMVGPMPEGELYTILLNLVSNSVKSVIAGGRPEKKIRVEAEARDKGVVFRILDNGMGLPVEFFEEVFTPFISDPTGELYDQLERRANSEDRSIFGTGSGLGLAIARDIAKARGGDIRFVQPPGAWKACVEVELP